MANTVAGLSGGATTLLVARIVAGVGAAMIMPVTLAALAVGSLALVGFFVFERRADHPLLDVRVFADRGLAAGSLTLLLVFAVMFGLFLVIVQYLQAMWVGAAMAAVSVLYLLVRGPGTATTFLLAEQPTRR